MFSPELEIGNSFAESPPDFSDLRYRVDAALKTIQFLDQPVDVEASDQAIARAAFTGALPPDHETTKSPGAIMHLKLMLSEYDQQVVSTAAQLRQFITNKLLEEATTAPSATARIQALKLLGQISDVGLFTEKTEVTYRHRPTEELERLLREKLEKVLDVDPLEEKMRSIEGEPK